jgi:hypothetical protein
MNLTSDELGDYVDSRGRTRRSTSAKQPLDGKRVGLALVAALVVSGGIAAITTTGPPRRTPSATVQPTARASSRQSPLGSPMLTVHSEYFWADQPTTASYEPRYGFRYDSFRGFFAPVEATIIRNRSGDYTIDVPNHGAPATVQLSAEDHSSSCYEVDFETFGHDQRLHVVCVNIGTSAPSVYTGPFAGGGTDSRFTVAIVWPATPPGFPAATTSSGAICDKAGPRPLYFGGRLSRARGDRIQAGQTGSRA